MTKDKLFRIVKEELSHNEFDMDIWAKALEDNNDDPQRAEEEYIKLRVAQLEAETAEPTEEKITEETTESFESRTEEDFGSEERQPAYSTGGQHSEEETKHSPARTKSRYFGVIIFIFLFIFLFFLAYLLHLYFS